MKKCKQDDMHRVDIVAAVRKTGTSIRQLSIDEGLHPNTLNNALRFKYPKGEKIIAAVLEMKPENIWPSRYINKQ